MSAKLELLNPGGSVKDRPARWSLRAAWERGEIEEDSHVVESSSGNFGIGLALCSRVMGLDCTCVVDPNSTTANRSILRGLGAKLEVVTELDEEGGYLQSRLATVKELRRQIPGAFWVNQYHNEDCIECHYSETATEILRDLTTPPDYLVLSVSTGATLVGIANRLRERFPQMEVIAVDAVGSVIFGGPGGPRDLPGLGASRRPENLDGFVPDLVIEVSDYDAAMSCRRLLASEGILAGGSSGACIAAIEHLLRTEKGTPHIVTLLADRGERYLDQIFDDDWLAQARDEQPNA